MAVINSEGSIIAACPGCDGARSTFEWRKGSQPYGALTLSTEHPQWKNCFLDYRLFRCAGCGRGGLGTIVYGGANYPGAYREVRAFFPDVRERLPLPKATPPGIVAEFREAEQCQEAHCLRAAAGMFRSVLDKTLRASAYKTKPGTHLEQEIDDAANDRVITETRRKRAHEELRVLGNDVLHDEWREIPEEDVEAAKHYMQRILEDFYDDREAVLKLLRQANRVAADDVPSQPTAQPGPEDA